MPQLKIVAAMLALANCAAPAELPTDKADSGVLAAELNMISEEKMTKSPPEPKREDPKPAEPAYRKTSDGVTGLPGGDGQTFQKLDDYLAHLEKGGHLDRPFWERLKSGEYRWNTGRGMQFQEHKYATREELLAKYGFSE